jgi:hypothetical protein
MNYYKNKFDESKVTKVVFEDIDECIEFKNKLITFIKRKKRDMRDKGIVDANLTFTFIKNLKK